MGIANSALTRRCSMAETSTPLHTHWPSTVDLRVDEPEVEAPQTEVEPETPPSTTAPLYTFDCAVPDDHFLAKWVAYASERTDAAHEYHEAAGLAYLRQPPRRCAPSSHRTRTASRRTSMPS